MDISNINASNAYATKESAKPPIDNTLLKNLHQEPKKADLNQETTRQQAFEVNITQEAQDRLAAEATPTKTEPAETPGPDQSPAATQEARQIVNIIA